MRNIDVEDPGLAQWVREQINGPVRQQAYSITELPDAAEWRGATLFVTDGASNRPSVTSDGTAWRYQDGTTV